MNLNYEFIKNDCLKYQNRNRLIILIISVVFNLYLSFIIFVTFFSEYIGKKSGYIIQVIIYLFLDIASVIAVLYGKNKALYAIEFKPVNSCIVIHTPNAAFFKSKTVSIKLNNIDKIKIKRSSYKDNKLILMDKNGKKYHYYCLSNSILNKLEMLDTKIIT